MQQPLAEETQLPQTPPPATDENALQNELNAGGETDVSGDLNALESEL